MKKKTQSLPPRIYIIAAVFVILVPIMFVTGISWMQVKPLPIEKTPDEPVAQAPETPSEIVTPTQKGANPSATFMAGYWDGFYGKWIGPVRWTVSAEYRQGNMLGAHDRKNGNKPRYAPK